MSMILWELSVRLDGSDGRSICLVGEVIGVKCNWLFHKGVTFISQGGGALPVAFMAEIFSLKTSVITGLITTIVGCVMKNVAVQRHLYWLLFSGQFISQISWVFVTAFGGRFANLWCKKNEIALASALAIAGSALGTGLGYIIPSIIVTDFNSNETDGSNTTNCENCADEISDKMETIQHQLLILGGFLNWCLDFPKTTFWFASSCRIQKTFLSVNFNRNIYCKSTRYACNIWSWPDWASK